MFGLRWWDVFTLPWEADDPKFWIKIKISSVASDSFTDQSGSWSVSSPEPTAALRQRRQKACLLENRPPSCSGRL